MSTVEWAERDSSFLSLSSPVIWMILMVVVVVDARRKLDFCSPRMVHETDNLVVVRKNNSNSRLGDKRFEIGASTDTTHSEQFNPRTSQKRQLFVILFAPLKGSSSAHLQPITLFFLKRNEFGFFNVNSELKLCNLYFDLHGTSDYTVPRN